MLTHTEPAVDLKSQDSDISFFFWSFIKMWIEENLFAFIFQPFGSLLAEKLWNY